MCKLGENVLRSIPQSVRFFVPIHNWGRIMDSPQYSRDQARVDTVVFLGIISYTQKAEVGLSANKVMAIVYL